MAVLEQQQIGKAQGLALCGLVSDEVKYRRNQPTRQVAALAVMKLGPGTDSHCQTHRQSRESVSLCNGGAEIRKE